MAKRLALAAAGPGALRNAGAAAVLAVVALLPACRKAPELPTKTPPAAERPNVLVFLGDTVRADALGAYGAGPGRTPAIDALAAEGTRFAAARAASSWTLPSVASLFTSLWPHEIANWAELPQRVPEEATTLAEIFRAAGYATGGFSANVLVTREAGYAQGFDAFWAPPLEASLWTDAATTASRAVEWLGPASARPFFAYVHFVDPHSPYCPPERRPKDPRAPVPGDMSRAFYGKDPFPDAARLREWRSLYAEEVALVDRGVARVLAALSPEVRRRTYVVFVSDHGEEFWDHGFLGHGWSLYDELLRVPFVIAGPGVRAGRVIAEPVGLIDLLPTLASLAAVRVDGAVSGGWRGVDLSAALRGEPRPLRPDRAFLAETDHYGPLRTSVQRGRWKAIFFNREPGAAPALTPHTAGAARVAALLPREALFDLAADPGERASRIRDPGAGALLRDARALVLDSVGRALPGRWVAVAASGPGGRIEGRVRYSAAVGRIVPLFLKDGESLSARGNEVRVSLDADGSSRGWLLPDRPGVTLEKVELRAGGLLLPARTARGPGSEPGWTTWAVASRGRGISPSEMDEQIRRLRALGYLK